MGTKQNPGKFDCHANALPDEPMFILLARDPSAPGLVKEWGAIRADAVYDSSRPKTDLTMVVDADDCAEAMKQWRIANDGRWRTEKAPPDPTIALRETNKALVAALNGLLAGPGWPDMDSVAVIAARAALAAVEQV
jgi:hypothetical protein